MASDEEIEEIIQEKDLTAPRVKLDRLEEVIKTVDFHVFPKSQLTVCCITLENGFNVTGESACASPMNFNKELGEKISYENAKNKIWQLEGYLLKQKLYEEECQNGKN